MAHYRITGWDQYQHYKDRDPPWIKLHRDMLTSNTWVSLDNDGRALAVACMLVAAGTDNKIPADPQYMRRRAYFDSVPDFAPLVEVGFIELVGEIKHLDKPAQAPASAPQASATKRSSESEAQDKTEEEKRKRGGAVAPLPPIRAAVDLFNEFAGEHGWSKVQVLSPPRSRALAACLKAVGDINGWQSLLAKATESNFLMGRTARSGEHANWRFDFDFVVQPRRYIKIMEGGYDNVPNSQHTPERGIGAALAALAD